MVFYFTGTGNSLYAAKNLDAEMVSIPLVVNSGNLVFTAERIGIVCPIYGHEMPAMVKDFICKATFHTDYLYLVLTYGARHGNAVELAEQVLLAAGKRADYITTLLMVDNFLPVFDMLEQMALNKNVEGQLATIKADILAKKLARQPVTQEDRDIHQGYLRLVENAPETVWAKFAVTDECIGCGICTKVCPTGCIHLEIQKAVYAAANCQACYACIHACTEMAIELRIPEKNSNARYRNKHITLCELVAANNQTEN